MIFQNGTINNVNYKKLCKVEHGAKIAYNNQKPYIFEISNITNSMVGFPHEWLIEAPEGYLIGDHEILQSFFDNYNVKPTWINCNSTWGYFDDETGHWTGAVGQVLIKLSKYCCFIHSS